MWWYIIAGFEAVCGTLLGSSGFMNEFQGNFYHKKLCLMFYIIQFRMRIKIGRVVYMFYAEQILQISENLSTYVRYQLRFFYFQLLVIYI